jgi:hypothetical protein
MCMSEKPRVKGVILKRISLEQGGSQVCGYNMTLFEMVESQPSLNILIAQ